MHYRNANGTPDQRSFGVGAEGAGMIFFLVNLHHLDVRFQPEATTS